MLSKSCKYCGEQFEKPYGCSINAWNNRKKFCSKDCVYLNMKNKHPWNYGKKMGEMPKKHRIKISSALKGKKTWNTGLTKETDIRLKRQSVNVSGVVKFSGGGNITFYSPVLNKIKLNTTAAILPFMLLIILDLDFSKLEKKDIALYGLCQGVAKTTRSLSAIGVASEISKATLWR